MGKTTIGALRDLASESVNLTESPRRRKLLDEQWCFHLGDISGKRAAAVGFDDSNWRVVDLPHDWSIELPVTGEEDPFMVGIGYFKDGVDRFFQNGVGWYRKGLEVEPGWVGNRVMVEFEGVYRNAEVFVNGQRAGAHPWGFTPFTVDLTPHLEGLSVGDPVVIAVRANNEQDIHTGSGIYRHVWLHVFGPTHILSGGLYPVTTALSAQEASLWVEASVGSFERNARGFRKVSVEFEVFELDADAEFSAPPVASGRASGTLVIAETRFSAELKVANPRAWSPKSPSLYRVVAKLYNEAGTLLDEYSVVTGIRTLAWSAERGLELNGESIKLNGGNIRHDTGILGAAAFDRAEERKIELLKEAGFNAVRTAHNPFSPAFLAACDRLGMLVMDEMFFSWGVPKQKGGYHELWAEWRNYDVEAWVRRGRHHPSVILWSIGADAHEKARPEGVAIARELSGFVRALDNTRPITVGLDGAWVSRESWLRLDSIFAELDIAGYQYALASRDSREPGRKYPFKVYSEPTYAVDHERVPNRIIVATESFQFELFRNWQVVQQQPYVLGDFVWTAMDYLGDATLGIPYPRGVRVWEHWKGGEEYTSKPWFWRGSYCGDIDLIGWRKPISHYREIVWGGSGEEKAGGRAGPRKKLYMAVLVPPPNSFESAAQERPNAAPEVSQPEEAQFANAWNFSDWIMAWAIPPALPTWTWSGYEGEPLVVEVYSRYEAVRLYLNGERLGERPTGEAEEFKAQFPVPYAAGELVAVGLQGGREIERFELETADEPAQLCALADRCTGYADGQDILFVTIEACDLAGRWHPWAMHNIQVEVEGAASLMGLGTANMIGSIPYPDSRCVLFHGRALAAIRTARQPGVITVRVSSPEGLTPTELQLEARAR